MTTADEILAKLQPYDLKREGEGKYRSNSPLRPGSNSHPFTLKIEPDGEHGTWYDHRSGETGSLYELADKLGVDRAPLRAHVPDTKRPYTDLADYARAHGVPVEVFKAAGWQPGEFWCPTHQRKRPALLFDTKTGTRARFIDGLKPPYMSPAGYRRCWYGLDHALAIAERTEQPLIICNGEASVVAAHHHDVAAIAITGGGENGIPAEPLEELQRSYDGPLRIALDCDEAGRTGAMKMLVTLSPAGFEARALDLNGGHGFDLADFARLYGPKTAAALEQLKDLSASSEARGCKLLHADELGTLPKPSWLIPGVLPMNKISQIFGRPGSGKSHVNLDIALSVAQFANVVYIAAEDAEDYQERIPAWCAHHQLGTGKLYFWPEPVNLLNPEAVALFLSEVSPLQPALIIVDTLANCMVGADENSTREMGLAIDALNYIRRQTNAGILVCHHTGWSDQHERGNSALRAACRVVMKLSQNDDGLLTLTCEKANGSERFEPRYFRLIPQQESVALIPSSKITTRDAALTEKHYAVLEALSLPIFAGGATHSQLVEHLDFSKSTVNYCLSKLMARDLVEATGGRFKQYKLSGGGDAELQHYLFKSGEANSAVVQSQFNGQTELRLNWAVTASREADGKFNDSSAPVALQDAVVQQVQSEFSVSSVPDELFSSVSPSLEGTPLNSKDTEPNNDQLHSSAQESLPSPLHSDLEHDQRLKQEIESYFRRGAFGLIKLKLRDIRGNTVRSEMEAALEAALEAAHEVPS
jgi:hypothetical protein